MDRGTAYQKLPWTFSVSGVRLGPQNLCFNKFLPIILLFGVEKHCHLIQSFSALADWGKKSREWLHL